MDKTLSLPTVRSACMEQRRRKWCARVRM